MFHSHSYGGSLTITTDSIQTPMLPLSHQKAFNILPKIKLRVQKIKGLTNFLKTIELVME